MAVFFMFGKYTPPALKGISGERSAKAREIIRGCGGDVKAMYALLGPHDLVMIVDFPGPAEAMKASIGLTRLTEIFFSSCPALSVDDFDRMMASL